MPKMNVWMLKCEDLTELGEMNFTLGVDEKLTAEAMGLVSKGQDFD